MDPRPNGLLTPRASSDLVVAAAATRLQLNLYFTGTGTIRVGRYDIVRAV